MATEAFDYATEAFSELEVFTFISFIYRLSLDITYLLHQTSTKSLAFIIHYYNSEFLCIIFCISVLFEICLTSCNSEYFGNNVLFYNLSVKCLYIKTFTFF